MNDSGSSVRRRSTSCRCRRTRTRSSSRSPSTAYQDQHDIEGHRYLHLDQELRVVPASMLSRARTRRRTTSTSLRSSASVLAAAGYLLSGPLFSVADACQINTEVWGYRDGVGQKLRAQIVRLTPSTVMMMNPDSGRLEETVTGSEPFGAWVNWPDQPALCADTGRFDYDQINVRNNCWRALSKIYTLTNSHVPCGGVTVGVAEESFLDTIPWQGWLGLAGGIALLCGLLIYCLGWKRVKLGCVDVFGCFCPRSVRDWRAEERKKAELAEELEEQRRDDADRAKLELAREERQKKYDDRKGIIVDARGNRISPEEMKRQKEYEFLQPSAKAAGFQAGAKEYPWTGPERYGEDKNAPVATANADDFFSHASELKQRQAERQAALEAAQRKYEGKTIVEGSKIKVSGAGPGLPPMGPSAGGGPPSSRSPSKQGGAAAPRQGGGPSPSSVGLPAQAAAQPQSGLSRGQVGGDSASAPPPSGRGGPDQSGGRSRHRSLSAPSRGSRKSRWK